MDSKLTLLTEQSGDGFYVAQFKTSELAIYSYYIESQKEAVLVDPVFNVQVYSDFIEKRHTVLRYVFLTHYHADYLSGHTEYKVPIVMGPESTRSVNKFEIK
jgi:glyoxylase-like metal-dependent hydrolase (beta-lactamase superfamily II)